MPNVKALSKDVFFVPVTYYLRRHVHKDSFFFDFSSISFYIAGFRS